MKELYKMSRFTSTMVISAVFLIGVACGGGGGSGGGSPVTPVTEAAETAGGEIVIVGPCDNEYRDDVARTVIDGIRQVEIFLAGGHEPAVARQIKGRLLTLAIP